MFPWVESVLIPGPPPVMIPMHRGYYLLGRQKSSDGSQWRAAIARIKIDGTYDTSFGSSGWMYANPGIMTGIVDALVANGKAYFLANLTVVQPATRVICVDLASGDNCFTGFNGLVTWGATAAGPRTAAYGQRLAYDSRYGIYVAARIMNNNRGEEVGIARISASDGTLTTSFGNNGYNIGLPNWASPGDAQVSVNDMIVTPAGISGGTRLYIAGAIKRSAGDNDGFILGLGPDSGTTQTGWSWNDQAYCYENDNTGDKNDAVTAITVLRNGKIAYAGWSQTDSANVQPLIMGRLAADGSYDDSFCAGNPDRGARACLVDPPSGFGPFYHAPYALPVAIGERVANRDLVVTQRFVENGNDPVSQHAVRVRTQQFSASGNTLHAFSDVSMPGMDTGNPASWWTRPFGMYLGPAAVTPEVLAVVGTRQYAGDDYDTMLIHYVANDTIFVDQFGKGNSD